MAPPPPPQDKAKRLTWFMRPRVTWPAGWPLVTALDFPLCSARRTHMGGSCPSTFIRAHESMVWQLSECPGHTSPPVLAASLKAPSGRSASPSIESYLGTRQDLTHTFMPRTGKVCNRECNGEALECNRVSSSSFHTLHGSARTSRILFTPRFQVPHD